MPPFFPLIKSSVFYSSALFKIIITMCKPKIIIVEQDSAVLKLLEFFLSARGYEICMLPKPSFCQLYQSPDDFCTAERCTDMLIMDCETDELALLQKQPERGCKLDVRNRAVISSDVVGDMRLHAERVGCAYFEKPFRLSELTAWLHQCEERLNICTKKPGKTDC